MFRGKSAQALVVKTAIVIGMPMAWDFPSRYTACCPYDPQWYWGALTYGVRAEGQSAEVANSEVLSTSLMRVRDSVRHLHYWKSAKRHKVRLP